VGGYEQQSAGLAPEAQDSKQEGRGPAPGRAWRLACSEIGKQHKFLSSEHRTSQDSERKGGGVLQLIEWLQCAGMS
jgi:hypothetical protein